MSKPLKYEHTLTSASVEAAAMSLKEKRKIYIVVNDDGDCALSHEPIPDATTAVYSNGSQIPIDSTTTDAPTKSGKRISTAKGTAVNEPKKQIKKNVKKVVKKAASVKVDKTISASSINDAIKQFIASKRSNAAIKVGGKEYGIRKGSTWVLSKGLVAKGKAGIIMLVDGQKGHYLYPSSDYKKIFGKIFASGTWKKHGSYGQSTFAGTHDAYWHD